MENEKPGPISEWIRIEITPEGYWVRVMPGARAFSLPDVLAYLLSLGIPGVDFHAVKGAYDAQSGTARPISGARHADMAASSGRGAATPHPAVTPMLMRATPPPIPPAPRPSLSIETKGADIYLTMSADAVRPPLSAVLAQVPDADASRLDLALLRTALAGARGMAHRISRRPQAEMPKRAPDLRIRKPAEGILLACGEERLRERLAETLSKRGLTVHVAADAMSAMAETVRQMPDVLLLTHPLGSDDGVELVREVRKDPRTHRTPIIVIPNNPSREVVEGAVRAGANDLVVRPVMPAVLLKKVGEALETIGKALPPLKGAAADPAASPEDDDLKTAGRLDVVKLARRVDKLLALPPVVHKLVSAVGSDRPAPLELGLAIQADPSMTTTVLRAANSPCIGRKDRTSELQEALARLGTSQARLLVAAMGAIHLFAKGQRSIGFNRVEFWRHSVATAVLARLLAERAAYPSPDLAFVAGLLHDIGKILLDEYAGPELERAALRAIRDQVPMRVAERLVMEADHAELGWAVLELWELPSAITTAVGRHHELPRPEERMDAQQERLCRVVHAANLLAKALGEGNGGDQSISEPGPGFWTSIGLSDGMREELSATFQEELARMQEFLDLGESGGPFLPGSARPAVLLDTSGSQVSLLGIALDHAGWKVTCASSAEQAGRCGSNEAQVLVVRAATTQDLAGACTEIRAKSRLPIVGVLPEGQPRLDPVEGFACLVEPYDRLELLRALPGG